MSADWARGWSQAPAQGLPAAVKGFTDFKKKSWMTETSGESTPWLYPTSALVPIGNGSNIGGNGSIFPSQGAWSIALKIQQALTTGQQSAWLYWTFASPSGKMVDAFHLTDDKLLDQSPKCESDCATITRDSSIHLVAAVTAAALARAAAAAAVVAIDVAAKHFYRYIRPNAVAHATSIGGPATLLASSFLHPTHRTITVVLVNAAVGQELVRLPASALSLIENDSRRKQSHLIALCQFDVRGAGLRGSSNRKY